MTNTPTSTTDRYAHLRTFAATRKQATFDRLKQAITQLEGEGRPVTTFTVREVSRLDYMAYYRNPEALLFFRQHSTHLCQERARKRAKQRASKYKRGKQEDNSQEEIVQSRDPLLNYKKPRLVAELRGALAERDQAHQRYRTLLQEHMECELTIARLEAQIAEYLAYMEGFRLSLQKEEHHPKE